MAIAGDSSHSENCFLVNYNFTMDGFACLLFFTTFPVGVDFYLASLFMPQKRYILLYFGGKSFFVGLSAFTPSRLPDIAFSSKGRSTKGYFNTKKGVPPQILKCIAT
jgi:hypothetical protein